MEYSKIVAIIRTVKLEEVEKRLQEIGISGISVSQVKGYGEYQNFFSRDWMVSHARIEIFCYESRVDEIVQAIMGTAHSGSPGDGIVAVIPVKQVFRIRTRSAAVFKEG